MIPFVATEKFTAGRCLVPPNKLAIVLHEYDGDLSQLDNEMLNCADAPMNPTVAYDKHTSFHYGVAGAITHQFVSENDTAWAHGNPASFSPSWTLPTVYPGVNPDCYTINIAVSTGQAGLSLNCAPGANNYDGQTLQTLVNLVCDIAIRNSIAPDTVHIVRHGNELADMDFTAFLTAVTTCVNAPVVSPAANDYICDQLKDFPIGSVNQVVGFDLAGNCVKGAIPGGGSPTTFLYTAPAPGLVHVVNHGLGFNYPNFQVYDAAGNAIGSAVSVVNNTPNQLTFTFSTPEQPFIRVSI